MTPYYRDRLNKSLPFQDHVAALLIKQRGLALTTWTSREWQLSGENFQGVEIKYDREMHKTGNLYIEIAEKTWAENAHFVKSGIFRGDNSWLYAIGDYSVLYVFGMVQLRKAYSLKMYREVDIATSKGFLLPKAAADNSALLKIETPENEPLMNEDDV